MDTAGPGTKLFTLTTIMASDICLLTPVLGEATEGTGLCSYPTPAPNMKLKGCREQARARASQAGALQKGLLGSARVAMGSSLMAITEKGLNLRWAPWRTLENPSDAKLGGCAEQRERACLEGSASFWLCEESTFLCASVSLSVKWG